DESLYASGPYGLARSPLHRSARSATPSPDGDALQLTLDSISGARSLNRPTTRPKPLFPQQPLATLPAILDSNGTDPISARRIGTVLRRPCGNGVCPHSPLARTIAFQRNAVHEAPVSVIVVHGIVLGAAVVPEGDRADPP